MNARLNPSEDVEAAYRTAVRLLGRRAHSRSELARKLRQRGVTPTTAAEALQRCEAHRYIDDAATAESYCCELVRKGYGPRAIRQRLVGRGLDGDVIDHALATRCPPEAVRESAKKAASRKAEQLRKRYAAPVELRPRLARFLTQRGFPAELVATLLDEEVGR